MGEDLEVGGDEVEGGGSWHSMGVIYRKIVTSPGRRQKTCGAPDQTALMGQQRLAWFPGLRRRVDKWQLRNTKYQVVNWPGCQTQARLGPPCCHFFGRAGPQEVTAVAQGVTGHTRCINTASTPHPQGACPATHSHSQSRQLSWHPRVLQLRSMPSWMRPGSEIRPPCWDPKLSKPRA